MTSPPAPTPHASASAPGNLPVVKLHELLDDLNASYAWYARLFPRSFWAKQPDPVAACQELTALVEEMDCIIEFAQEVKRHALLLFDLSSNEAERRRG